MALDYETFASVSVGDIYEGYELFQYHCTKQPLNTYSFTEALQMVAVKDILFNGPTANHSNRKQSLPMACKRRAIKYL